MNKLSVLILFLLMLSVACQKQLIGHNSAELNNFVEKSAQGISAEPALYFDSLFTRYKKGELTGGDVAYSHLLPDGRSLWLFGDSFVDTVFPNRHRPVGPFIHSTLVTTDTAGLFKTYFNGTVNNPRPFFEAEEPIQLWPNCAFLTSDNKKAIVMMVVIKATGEGGLFGFKTVGNAAGVLSLPELTLDRIIKISDHPKIDWSSATYEEGDYVYLYGAEATADFPYTKYMHISRTSRTNPMQQIEFYNGKGWSRDSAKSKRVISGISQQYSVFKHNNKYYLLSQEGIFLSPTIYMWDAASPVGPFTNKRKIYTTPQADGKNIITYNAIAHTEFIQDGKLLIGYCTNSLDGTDMFKNADTYRPYFIWVNGWE